MNEKNETLRLADALIHRHGAESFEGDAAAELRRLAAVEAQRDVLLEAIKPLIDLAEFWINHRQKGHMGEQEFKVWLALGHESNAMLNARAAIKAVEENT